MRISAKGRAAVAAGLPGVSDGAKLAVLLLSKMDGVVTREHLGDLMAELIAECRGDVKVALELVESGIVGVEPVGWSGEP